MAADYKTLLTLVREFVKETDEYEETDPRTGGHSQDLMKRARAAIQRSAPKPEKLAPATKPWEGMSVAGGKRR